MKWTLNKGRQVRNVIVLQGEEQEAVPAKQTPKGLHATLNDIDCAIYEGHDCASAVFPQ